MPLQATIFSAGSQGTWKLESVKAIKGETLPLAPYLSIGESAQANSLWQIKGVGSYERYTTRPEKSELVKIQPALGRPEATCGALIPMAKDERWWAMTPEERRAIFEEQSQHIAIGMRALPAIARKLYQSRDFGEAFDFVTYFEFAPEHAGVFDEILAALRSTKEWDYVSREVEFRLTRV